jgi:hypothetical protein
VRWGMTESELLATLPITPRHVTAGYYIIDCNSLAGLHHALGFQFRPRENGELCELEFFRAAPGNQVVQLSGTISSIDSDQKSTSGSREGNGCLPASPQWWVSPSAGPGCN